MKTPDKVAMLLEAALKDEAKVGPAVLSLLEHVLWFPVEYHPELGNPFEPGTDAVIPIWIGGDARGEFIPVFSSPKLMREGLASFTRKHTRARMDGRKLFEYLATRGREVRVNPGSDAMMRMNVETVQKLASGEMEREAAAGEEQVRGTLKFLPPEAWPEEHRGMLAEECEKDEGVIAVWLAEAEKTTDVETADALHIVVWLRDLEHTPFHALKRAVHVAFAERKVAFVRMDEAHHGSIETLRVFPPVWPRAD